VLLLLIPSSVEISKGSMVIGLDTLNLDPYLSKEADDLLEEGNAIAVAQLVIEHAETDSGRRINRSELVASRATALINTRIRNCFRVDLDTIARIGSVKTSSFLFSALLPLFLGQPCSFNDPSDSFFSQMNPKQS